MQVNKETHTYKHTLFILPCLLCYSLSVQ